MIRWLAALWVFALGTPALADEMRPVVIQFEQVSQDRWRLGPPMIAVPSRRCLEIAVFQGRYRGRWRR